VANLLLAEYPQAWDLDFGPVSEVIVFFATSVFIDKGSGREEVCQREADSHDVVGEAFGAPLVGFLQVIVEDLLFGWIVQEQLGIESWGREGHEAIELESGLRQGVRGFDGSERVGDASDVFVSRIFAELYPCLEIGLGIGDGFEHRPHTGRLIGRAEGSKVMATGIDQQPGVA